MAFIEDALKQILSEDPDVVALVGTRITPGTLSQNATYPAIAFRNVGVEREPVLDSKTTGPAASRFIFFSCAKLPDGDYSARRVASLVDKAVRHALQGYKDVVIITALSPAEMVDVQGIFFAEASDLYDDRSQTYQYASVFDVRHSEEVPD